MYDNPPFWEHGAFLQPQHFQLAELQARRGLARALALLNPYLWGVRRLEVNETAIDNGAFEVVNLDLLLPGGEWASVPGNATLPPRSFRETWANTDTPLTIYLGLAPFREQGGNARRADDPAAAPETSRFTAPLAPELVPDLHGDGPPAEVFTLRYNLRLLLGPDEGPDLWKIPVARLKHDGERVRLDQAFAPPCVDINGAPALHRLARDCRDTLLARAGQLEEYKIVAGDTGLSGVSSLYGVTLFSLLGVLSRFAPELDQCLKAPACHPWPLYRVLARLVGELSVFSASLSPLAETPQGAKALPDYDHGHLYECFSAAANIISRLVNTLVIGPAFMFKLEPQGHGGALATVMPANALARNYGYWLLLRTADAALADEVALLAKLAPSADLAAIAAQALPGIRLSRVESPPAGLPRRPDTLYFSIDQGDPLWQKIMQTGDLALMLPRRPADLLAQLAVIQR